MTAAASNTEPIIGSLDDVADHVMAARNSAAQLSEEFLTYLLDMVLVEIVNRGVTRAD